MYPVSRPLVGTPLNFGHPLCRSLGAYWPLWEGNGTKVYDISGNRQVGTLTGIAQGSTSGWSGGRAGGAGLLLDGTDDYVLIADAAPQDNVAGGFTLAAWFRSVQSNTTTDDYLISKSTTTIASYGLYLNSTGTFKVAMLIQDAGGSKLVASDRTGLNDGRWHLAMGTWDRTTMRIYVDGSLQTTSTAAAVPVVASPSTLMLGVFNNLGTPLAASWFAGTIGDCYLWNRSLIPAEGAQLYAQPYDLFMPSNVYRRLPGRTNARLGA